ncbi:hypothetical protein E4T48_04406 [Aureobasidium sp. EXF-10727]|nr:hypothetical protein E4T48_04406 [Aureobasidium sp. EXF-10727]KAI4724668.1 hypothetical protein E4T49_07595 [Aureobasidium sp. EXF-10728]
MANVILPTRYRETSDGWVREHDDQQPTSILHKHVLDTKDEFIISSFDANVMELRITVGMKMDIDTWEATPDPNAFHFALGCQGRQRTLNTRFDEEQEQVQVCLNNNWIPMVDYLEDESKKDESNPNHLKYLSPKHRTELATNAQQRWWDANKKSFPLLDLPSELRHEIYRQAGPQDAIEPYARHCMRGKGMPDIDYRNAMVSNLLRCNKVVAQEMRTYMFKYLPLLINHERLLSKTLRRNLDFPRNLLTHLILALPTHRDIINIFGLTARNINTDQEITIEPKEFTALSLDRDTLRFIKKLEIIIPSREVLDKTYVNHCHTKATTMLLEIMWPYVQGHPVVLGGMIKKWQKKLWEKKFAQAHTEYEERLADTENGGTQITQEDRDRLDGKAANNEYDEDGNCRDCAMSFCLLHYEEPEDEYEYLIPFICQCDPPCLYGEWTDKDRIRDKDED